MEYLEGDTAEEKLAFAQESSDPVVMYRCFSIYKELGKTNSTEVFKLIKRGILKVTDDHSEIKYQIKLAKDTNDALRLLYLRCIMDVGIRSFDAVLNKKLSDEVRDIVIAKRKVLKNKAAITSATNKIRKYLYRKPTWVKAWFTKDDIENFKDTRITQPLKYKS